MTIRELIEALEAVLDTHGDVEVWIMHREGCFSSGVEIKVSDQGPVPDGVVYLEGS